MENLLRLLIKVELDNIVRVPGSTIDRVLVFYLDHPELKTGHSELDSGSQETNRTLNFKILKQVQDDDFGCV